MSVIVKMITHIFVQRIDCVAFVHIVRDTAFGSTLAIFINPAEEKSNQLCIDSALPEV